MPVLSPPSPLRDIHALLDPLVALDRPGSPLRYDLVASFPHEGEIHPLPRLVFSGPPAAHDPIRLALFGGLHGDEPASVLAPLAFLERLVADPARATGYNLTVYPLCNPVGYARATRHNGADLDLNREFWRGSVQPEVVALERDLAARDFDGIITLHADDTAEGVYGYTHGRVLNEALLEPALRSAGYILPRDRRAQIDGFPARDGKIDACFQGILCAPPGRRPRPFDLIFETPARAPIDLQVEAAVTALDTILDEYRVFLAYAPNL
jgi:hypothetical protein